MTLIIRDSFDFYSAVEDGGKNMWDIFISGNNSALVSGSNTRFGVGQALSLGKNNAVNLSKSHANYATVLFGFAMLRTNALGGTQNQVGIQFYDGTTVQCSVYFDNNGNINFYRGNAGTLLGTFSPGYDALVWHHYQLKVNINSATGSFELRKDGNTVNDYTLTGVNNRSTANNYTNNLTVIYNGAVGSYTMDDAVYCSVDGLGAPWDDWFGDIRALQVMPNADATPNQFTANASPVSVGNTVGGGTLTYSANVLSTLMPIQVPAGTCGSATITFNSGATGNVVAAIYDSDGPGGTPKTLLAVSNQVTNPVVGDNVFTFATPPTLVGDHTYWVAKLASMSITLVNNSVLGSIQQYTQGVAYTTSPPNFTVPVSASYTEAKVTLSMTPSGHFGYVQETAEDGTQTYLSDATVGDKELFTSAGLGTTPPSILGVSLRLFASKSDSGTRSAQPTMTSGATVQDGSAIPLATTMENIIQIQDVDPATSAAWTAAAVNALKFGFKAA